MAFEIQVVQDVKEFLLEELEEYAGCSEMPYGSEVYFLLTNEPNTNGTLDFDRQASLDYLNSHIPTLEAYLDYAIEEGFLDFEDVYEWSDTGESSYDQYVEDNAEALKVAIYIDIAEIILMVCPCIESRRDVPFDMNDEELVSQLRNELRSIDCADVLSYL
jgi:hypothetical protein